MTSEQFEALVARLEDRARRDPSGYRRRVFWLALLGDTYLAMVLLGLALLLAGAVVSIAWLKAAGVKLAIGLAVFLWFLLKALKVNLAPPEGIEIHERDAPDLFAAIERLRRAIGTPRFHRVLISDDFNAAVAQVPRLGLLGWPRNDLLIGLPLAKALTAEQFEAVLAHELGHVAKAHGVTSSWIYRQRLRWSRLMSELEQQQSLGVVLFRPFLRWYAPYFNAYSFPLARGNEYEADAAAARLTSPRALAEALTALEVVSGYLGERYWPEIHRRADDLPEPRFAPHSNLAPSLAREVDADSSRPWLERALERATTVGDTHPSLRDRLAALGEDARLALPGGAEASADRLFGESLPRLEEELDRRWREAVEPSWRDHHAQVQESRARLTELEAKQAGGAELSLQEAFELACLTGRHGRGDEVAIEQLQALLVRAPDDPAVLYELGVRLLSRDDEAGRALLARAMERDESEIVRCCEALRDQHWRSGRREEAHEWHRKAVERAALEQVAARERTGLHLHDELEPHELEPQILAGLQEALREVPELRRAYLVRKRVQYLPSHPLYVLGFTVAAPLRWRRAAKVAAAMEHIQRAVVFPGETLIINLQGENRRFGRRFRWRRGARIV